MNMSRDYFINGETMVKVKGNGPLLGANVDTLFQIPISAADIAAAGGGPGTPADTAGLHELGLASEGIRITPRYIHQDVHCDDFGPEIPAETLVQLADVRIEMTLVHYDKSILRACLAESMGGVIADGKMPPALRPMGGNKPLLASGNHYVSLNILSPQGGLPWRFPAAYLVDRPVEYPIGTERTAAKLDWRAIPYNYVRGQAYVSRGHISYIGGNPEVFSSGVSLWDHTLDT